MSTNAAIEKRFLGKTDVRVTPIGLGMMEFSGGGGWLGAAFPVIDQDEKNAIVKAALEGGINWFDTAEMYGGGVSERSLATALKAAGKSDSEVVVATKWLPLLRTAGNIPRTIHDRLRFLDGYSIGLYMVHLPWSFSSPEAEMRAMADLVAAGKIRSVGVSNFSAERMRRAHTALQERGLPLAVNQVRYSLLQREIETNGILETAKELGVTIIAYTPLASGLLTGKYHKNPELLKRQPHFRRGTMQRQLEASRPLVIALEEIAARYTATPAQVALNWVIHSQGETVVTIPGATKLHQAQESAGAMRFRLSESELARLDELSRTFRNPHRGKNMPGDGDEITRVTRSKDVARVSYDRLSKWYDLIAGSSERKFRDVGLDKLGVGVGERVLEIGFGTGHSLVALAQRVGTSGQVYGIDLSEGMFQLAEARVRAAGLSARVELARGDAAQLPYETDFFDAVLMSFVLELFDTPELSIVLGECRRVLRGHGRTSVVALSKKKGLAVTLYEWAHAQFPGTVDCRPIFVRKTLEGAGFLVVDSTEMSMWGLPVDVVVARKAML